MFTKRFLDSSLWITLVQHSCDGIFVFFFKHLFTDYTEMYTEACYRLVLLHKPYICTYFSESSGSLPQELFILKIIFSHHECKILPGHVSMITVVILQKTGKQSQLYQKNGIGFETTLMLVFSNPGRPKIQCNYS